jgi:hypothetical protein
MAKPCASPVDPQIVESPTPQKIRLHTADDVRVEMARVYREMRGGNLDMKKGCSLVYVLGQIGKLIEVSIVEKRIEQLEKTVEG